MYFTLFPSRPHIIATTKGDFQESSSPVLAVGPAPMKRPVLLNYGTTFTSALADDDGLFDSSSDRVWDSGGRFFAPGTFSHAAWHRGGSGIR